MTTMFGGLRPPRSAAAAPPVAAAAVAASSTATPSAILLWLRAGIDRIGWGARGEAAVGRRRCVQTRPGDPCHHGRRDGLIADGRLEIGPLVAGERPPGGFRVAERHGDLGLGREQLYVLAGDLAHCEDRHAAALSLRGQLAQGRGGAGHDESARALAEQRALARPAPPLDPRIEMGPDADAPRDRALRRRAGDPAVADVVNGRDPAAAGSVANELDRRAGLLDVSAGQAPVE